MPSYSAFAQFYDGLMTNAEYQKRCDYLCELLKRHRHDFGITLDLACGTGSLTRLLAKKGVDVYGIDASAEMLCEAMEKSAEEGLNILYLRQKMQNIDLYGTINTCICTLDSINHLTDEKDVKHRSVLCDNTFVYETDKVFCVWQNSLSENDVVEINLDFFEEENGVYYRTSESFCERAYSDECIRKMLSDTGFETEAVYGDLSFDTPKDDEQRVIYVARMKKSRNKKI